MLLFLFAGACTLVSCHKNPDDLQPALGPNDSTIFLALQGNHRLVSQYDIQHQSFALYSIPLYCRFTTDSVLFFHLTCHTEDGSNRIEETITDAYPLTFHAPATFYFGTLRYNADPYPLQGNYRLWGDDGSAYEIAAQPSDSLEIGVMQWKKRNQQ